MSQEIDLLAAFLIGLAGGVHCFGMCGGITVALQSAVPKQNGTNLYTLGYHLGRISSYTLAGGLTGLLGMLFTANLYYGVSILTLLSASLLILLACYIGNWYRGLIALEKIGAIFWRRLQPLAKSFIPFSNPSSAYAYGAVWGWLPCGLVYSTLSWSLASGSWLKGAGIMLAFGLGTLPVMLAISFSAGSIRPFLQSKVLRQIIAVLLMVYGLYLLFSTAQNIR